MLPERLAQPLHWRKPRKVFVNSMSDLFHDDVPFEFVAAVFGVMAATPQHTYQVLTTRRERALEFFAWVASQQGSEATFSPRVACYLAACRPSMGVELAMPAWPDPGPWPLPNVWLGVSAEDQAAADKRVPLLLQCPA